MEKTNYFSPDFPYAREFVHNFNYDSIGLQLVFAPFLHLLLLRRENEKHMRTDFKFSERHLGNTVCLSVQERDRQTGRFLSWVGAFSALANSESEGVLCEASCGSRRANCVEASDIRA